MLARALAGLPWCLPLPSSFPPLLLDVPPLLPTEIWSPNFPTASGFPLSPQPSYSLAFLLPPVPFRLFQPRPLPPFYPLPPGPAPSAPSLPGLQMRRPGGPSCLLEQSKQRSLEEQQPSGQPFTWTHQHHAHTCETARSRCLRKGGRAVFLLGCCLQRSWKEAKAQPVRFESKVSAHGSTCSRRANSHIPK